MSKSVTSTYRIQIRPGFDLDTAADLVGYLQALGATHLYSAPILTSVAGSEHGYDVADPTRVNPALGGPEALDRLVAALRTADMGLVVDIVPNHVGVAVPKQNPAWWSVLRDGQASPYARWFDIDWSRGPILIPVLADDAAVRDIKINGDELVYYDHHYPIAPDTFGSALETHARQHYRLIDWRRGDAELTYRRFFAVSDLAGVRVENPAVFAETHVEILRWIREGLVDGIRVDHPDGLRDPGRYLRRLRKLAPDTWLVVEKILEYGETLPIDWPVDGTTGYDALRYVCGVFIDADAVEAFPADVPFHDVALAGKRDAAVRLLGAELARLTRLVDAATHAASERSDSPPHDRPRVHDHTDRARRLRGAGRDRGAHAGLPDVPARRSGASRRRDQRRARRAGRRRHRPGRHDRPRRPAPRPGRRGGPALPAVHRRGHGQGRRGHRVLPVDQVRRAERGRRRAGPLRRTAGGVPYRDGAAP